MIPKYEIEHSFTITNWEKIVPNRVTISLNPLIENYIRIYEKKENSKNIFGTIKINGINHDHPIEFGAQLYVENEQEPCAVYSKRKIMYRYNNERSTEFILSVAPNSIRNKTLHFKYLLISRPSIFDFEMPIPSRPPLLTNPEHKTLCFFNVVTQLFFNIPKFRKLIFKIPDTSPKITSKKVAYYIQDLFAKMYKAKEAICSEKIRTSFGWHKNAACYQHDASEFFDIFIKAVWLKFPKESKIRKNFEKLFLVHYPNQDSIAFGVTVSDCQSNSLEEALTKITNVNKFTNLPQVLVFHISRATVKDSQIVKAMNYISYPGVLDMSPFIQKEHSQDSGASKKSSDDYEGQENSNSNCTEYELFSVIVHQQKSSNCGHFYLCARRSRSCNSWYKINDSIATPIDRPSQIFEMNYGTAKAAPKTEIHQEVTRTLSENRPASAMAKTRPKPPAGSLTRTMSTRMPQSDVGTASLLLYIRRDSIDDVMEPVPYEEVPEHVRNVINSEVDDSEKTVKNSTSFGHRNAPYLIVNTLDNYNNALKVNPFTFDHVKGRVIEFESKEEIITVGSVISQVANAINAPSCDCFKLWKTENGCPTYLLSMDEDIRSLSVLHRTIFADFSCEKKNFDQIKSIIINFDPVNGSNVFGPILTVPREFSLEFLSKIAKIDLDEYIVFRYSDETKSFVPFETITETNVTTLNTKGFAAALQVSKIDSRDNPRQRMIKFVNKCIIFIQKRSTLNSGPDPSLIEGQKVSYFEASKEEYKSSLPNIYKMIHLSTIKEFIKDDGQSVKLRILNDIKEADPIANAFGIFNNPKVNLFKCDPEKRAPLPEDTDIKAKDKTFFISIVDNLDIEQRRSLKVCTVEYAPDGSNAVKTCFVPWYPSESGAEIIERMRERVEMPERLTVLLVDGPKIVLWHTKPEQLKYGSVRRDTVRLIPWCGDLLVRVEHACKSLPWRLSGVPFVVPFVDGESKGDFVERLRGKIGNVPFAVTDVSSVERQLEEGIASLATDPSLRIRVYDSPEPDGDISLDERSISIIY